MGAKKKKKSLITTTNKEVVYLMVKLLLEESELILIVFQVGSQLKSLWEKRPQSVVNGFPAEGERSGFL